MTRPERNPEILSARCGCVPTTIRTIAQSFARVRQWNMDDFPKFTKHPANRIARSGQPTPGVEGYIFDGADGSQMAFGHAVKLRYPRHTPTITTSSTILRLSAVQDCNCRWEGCEKIPLHLATQKTDMDALFKFRDKVERFGPRWEVIRLYL